MEEEKRTQPIDILLVEDNPADVRLTREAFKETAIRSSLSVVGDGMAAMEFLHRTGSYAGAPVPDIVLLDLNLPKKDGREVLKEIKHDPKLGLIPVVILTTSRDEDDIMKTYSDHANCYITKPIELDAFGRVIRLIEEFWFATVRLPPKG
jgi:CheY-like chemotaxis protein